MAAATLTSNIPEPFLTDEDAPLLPSDALFRTLAAQHPDLRIEMTADGEVIVMAPAFSDTSRKNFLLTAQLAIWTQKNGTGVGFESSTSFTLPNGAKRSPDASWIEKSRWQALTDRERNDYDPICPDFVLELRSETDRLSTLQKKMREYLDNGAKLGWLIDPRLKRTEVYRPGQEPQLRTAADTLSGDPELPGFVLDLTEIFA